MTTTFSYLDVYAKVSETPKKSSKPEPVTSPEYGELAELLHEAALLEFPLEHGELPSKDAKKAGVELEKKERQEEMKKGEEREKQPVVKAKQGKKEHATMAKAHAKQEASASESKSIFCNPLLRSKSAQEQDESADSEAHKEKSVTLSFCLLPELPFFQSTSTLLAITPIPEKEVVPADAIAWDAEIKSSVQTSPRSLQYFTSLKHFVSVELEKKERQEEMKKGEEREKQPVVKAKQGKKKHATMANAHAKQEVSASKSKSVFCNLLLRSKSAQKWDKLVDSEAHKEKSVTLSFCPLPELPFFQSTSIPLAITPIPEKEVVPANAMAGDAEIKFSV
ncbi:hypothetical protein H2248_004051 [Termitomyces sp. 'cryptogamus']|nr:hypothetical protein H2248_004051 [Termitomyces sp. 'cryptogamus']